MNSKVKSFLLVSLLLLSLLAAAIFVLPRTILRDPAFELRMAADAGDTEIVRDILSSFPETVNEQQRGALSSTAINDVNSSFITDLKMRFSKSKANSDRFFDAVLKTNSNLTGVHRGIVTCGFGMRDTSGATALDNAVIWGQEDIVKLLLEHHADVSIKNRIGWTPLFYASSAGQSEIAEMLIQHGAEVSPRDNRGDTPLCAASLQGRTNIISILLAHGADINTFNNQNGYTPLHWALLTGNEPTVALLLEHGANVNAKDFFGRTPLTAVIRSGKTNIIELLRRYGGKESDPSEVRKYIQMNDRHDR